MTPETIKALSDAGTGFIAIVALALSLRAVLVARKASTTPPTCNMPAHWRRDVRTIVREVLRDKEQED